MGGWRRRSATHVSRREFGRIRSPLDGLELVSDRSKKGGDDQQK